MLFFTGGLVFAQTLLPSEDFRLLILQQPMDIVPMASEYILSDIIAPLRIIIFMTLHGTEY
jgi:hypothetical protein